MPKFENLEPYLDQERKGKVTPVAPYHSQAQTYQPSDSAPKSKRDRPLRQRTLRLPKVKLSSEERVTTQEMEKAYKAAVRKDKVRSKKRPGQSPFRRLLKKIASLFTSEEAKKKTAKKRPRNRKRDDRKPNDRSGGGRAQKKGARKQNNRRGAAKKSGQNKDQPKDGAQKKSPNRQRRPRKKRSTDGKGPRQNGESTNQPRNAPKKDLPDGKQPENAAKPKPQTASENTSQEPAKKNRKNRRNRSRRSSQGGNNDGPSRSDY